MFSLTSYLNNVIIFLNTTVVKDILSYIEKIGLLTSIAQYINYYLIFNDVYIDFLITALDIELIFLIFYCHKDFKLNSSLVIHIILEIF